MNPTVPTIPTHPEPEWQIAPWAVPDLSKLVTRDDQPVDSFFSEKQQRLLAHSLFASWSGPAEGKGFLVQANVGYFFDHHQPPLVPDVLLSLGVEVPDNLHVKEGHSYYQWELGKPPDVVIEIVSDKRGGELGHKMSQYSRQKISYYVIFDPERCLDGQVLQTFVDVGGGYEILVRPWFPNVGLGVTLWQGKFEGKSFTWLRWCDQDGNVIPTGEERADQEYQRAERLAAKLRAAGLDPDA